MSHFRWFINFWYFFSFTRINLTEMEYSRFKFCLFSLGITKLSSIFHVPFIQPFFPLLFFSKFSVSFCSQQNWVSYYQRGGLFFLLAHFSLLFSSFFSPVTSSKVCLKMRVRFVISSYFSSFFPRCFLFKLVSKSSGLE